MSFADSGACSPFMTEDDTSIDATPSRKNQKTISREMLLRELYDYLRMQRKRQADPKRMRAVILGYQVLLEHLDGPNLHVLRPMQNVTPDLVGLRLPGIDNLLKNFVIDRTVGGDAQVVEDGSVLSS